MAGARRTARIATIVSLIFGLWALAVAITPFFPSAVVAAAVGLALGLLALRTEKATGWRRAAVVGLALNVVAFAIVFVIFVALAV
jgi:hypothetical protein